MIEGTMILVTLYNLSLMIPAHGVSASELPGFTSTSILTMNEKFQFLTSFAEYGIENFD